MGNKGIILKRRVGSRKMRHSMCGFLRNFGGEKAEIS